MGQRVGLTGKLKPLGEGEAKASLNRAPSGVTARQSVGSDPKPGDLAMGRLKVR